jgi:UTP--glucose-1-phosphate uridylyltransferase
MIKKCIFPAAGYGTRFLPATKSIPKEMLPVVNKPLIHYGIEEANKAGIKEFGFVTGRSKRAIEDYLDYAPEVEQSIKGSKSKEKLLEDTTKMIEECTFTYVRQKEMKGLGHAILTAEPLVGNNPFAVVLADDLCEGDVLSQMVKLYNKFKCSIVAIEEVPKEETSKYGVIAGKEIEKDVFMINNMVEKPEPKNAPSNLAIIGRYILTPDIFNILRDTKAGKGGEIQITDALLEQAKNGMVIGYKFKGKRFDCGSVDGFIEATNHFYNKIKKNNNSEK